DNNRTFVFMIILTVIFVGINVYFMYNVKDVKSDAVISNGASEKKNSNIESETTPEMEFEALYEQKETLEENIIYENRNILLEISRVNGEIVKAYVKDSFLDKNQNKKFSIVTGKPNNNSLKLKFGSWLNGKTISELTGGKESYTLEKVDDKFIFSTKIKDIKNENIYKIEKIYTFVEDENIFRFDVKISNDKNEQMNFDSSDVAFSLGWGPDLNSDGQKFNKRYDMYSYFNGKKVEKIDIDNKLVKRSTVPGFGEKYRQGGESWIAREDRYFAAIIYPDSQNYKYFFDYKDSRENKYYCGFERYTENSMLESSFYIYIGPKIRSIVRKYNNFKDFKLNDTNFSKVVEYKFFGFGDVMGVILNFIYKLVKNYGLAIIILTVLIKLLLSPLTYKSMESQEKMGKLQPKLKELQEKYKDKPEILNRETMNLYKKEGVNPFGGCFPLLLQMPLLLAMYQLLDKMVELKGAGFLWIKDLSLPDAVINFNFTIPFVNISSFNILPIVMVATQIFSSLIMPDMQSNKQAKMMMWMMPLLFFFMFYNVSSGLVLYWTVMNILNVIQQLLKNSMKNKKILKKA
ncbi:MAG TPA: membrane protein insertase YidC, partial [Spirochaetota bacterium]|nr:membrane protein insertase YidC [Spirochaetota bacterium]